MAEFREQLDVIYVLSWPICVYLYILQALFIIARASEVHELTDREPPPFNHWPKHRALGNLDK